MFTLDQNCPKCGHDLTAFHKSKLDVMYQAIVETEAGYSAENVKNPQQHAEKPLSHTERITKFIASFVAWHALKVVFATEFRSAEEPEEVLLLLPQSIRNQPSSGICPKIPPMLLRKPSLRPRRS